MELLFFSSAQIDRATCSSMDQYQITSVSLKIKFLRNRVNLSVLRSLTAGPFLSSTFQLVLQPPFSVQKVEGLKAFRNPL